MALITVALTDQNAARRATCRRLLRPHKGIRVVGETEGALEAIALAARARPRILLLSLAVSRGNGAAILAALLRRSPRTRVILLTRRTTEARILDGLSRGARGYLEETKLRTFLPKAVRAVDAGQVWVPRKMVARILDRLAHLSPRTN